LILGLLLCRSIGRVTTVKTATARSVIIVLRVVGSRVWRNRVIIGDITGPVLTAWVRIVITRVRPVHPRVLAVNTYNVALLQLWLRVTRRLCQHGRIVTVDGSANVTVAVGDAGIRIGIFIGHSIYHSGWAGPVVTGRAYNRWHIHIDGVVTDYRATIITVVDIIYTYRHS